MGSNGDSFREESDADSEPSGSTPDAQVSRSYILYECDECSATVLGFHDGSAELSCHGKPMVPADETGIGHAEPALEDLFTDVYGLPKETVDVCHFVFENGTASVSDTAERFGYDSSTVSSVLRRLAEAGFLERKRMSLSAKDGSDDDSDEGEVEIYEAGSVEETHRAEMVGFLRWVGEAYEVLEGANRIKKACLEEDDYELDESFWEIYHERDRSRF